MAAKTRLVAIGVAGVLALAGGCNPTQSGGGDGGAEAGLPSAWRTVHFASDTYELAPGQERYLCYTMNLPSDAPAVVTAITPTYGQGTHHIFFGYTLSPEPAGVHECPQLFRQSWIPMFLGGVASNRLQMPPGVAMRLQPGQQIFLQLHLQSTSAETIRAHTDIDLSLGDPAQNFQAAGIFGFDQRDFVVQPRASNQVTQMSCVPGHDMNVFGVLAHMHKYGSRIDLFRGGLGSTDLLYGARWTFNDQPIAPLNIHVGSTEAISLRCQHSNPSDRPVAYGESSDTEMCAAVFYYYPSDGLDGCVVTPGSGDGGTGDASGGDGGNGGCATPPGPMDPCVRTCNTGNSRGVGRYCTAGGGQCSGAGAFICTADVGASPPGFCTLPCSMDAQCGAGAVCHHDPMGSGCVPVECESPAPSDGGVDSGAADSAPPDARPAADAGVG